MKKRTYGFENLKVASPCHESWDNMTGDEKVKFCGACERPVYNLSSLTGHQIAELIRETEGTRTCVRFYRRQDGTMLTQDCPVGHRKARRKAVGFVAAAAVAIFGGPMVYNALNDSSEELIMGMMVKPPVVIDQSEDRIVMGEMVITEEEENQEHP